MSRCKPWRRCLRLQEPRKRDSEHTLLRINFVAYVPVHSHDEEITDDIYSAAGIQDVRVIEGNPFGHLKHAQDNGQVRSGGSPEMGQFSVSAIAKQRRMIAALTFGG